MKKNFCVIKLVVWVLVVGFCALCTFEVLPLHGPKVANWLAAACGFFGAVVDVAERRFGKDFEGGKFARGLAAFGGVMIIVGAVWSPGNDVMLLPSQRTPELPMGVTDWVIIALLYLGMGIEGFLGMSGGKKN